MRTDTKIAKRKEELTQRTSKIFSITPEESETLFKHPKMSVIQLNNSTKDFIGQNIKAGNLKPITWVENAYTIEQNKDAITHSTPFETGQIYVQNISSILPVIALDPKPTDTILDMCAAPGGKTIQIANKSQNSALITVNDENPTRIHAMKRLFETYKVKIQEYYTQPAQYLTKHLPLEYFDKILLDAPCSGEGLIDFSKPSTLGFWSTKKIKRLNKLQKSIIAEAYKLLKPNGTLVYSTCTLAPEENEEVISWALNNFKDLEVQELAFKNDIVNSYNGLTSWKDKPLSTNCKKCLRVKPNDYMEAFFVCKLKKVI